MDWGEFMIKFLYPMMFLLILAPFVIRAILKPVKGIHGDALRVPFLRDIKNISIKSGKIWNVGLPIKSALSKPIIWLYIIWILLSVAAARPQLVGEPIRIKNYGRDILMVIDLSTSMLQRDFVLGGYSVSRLSAVKFVASQFIQERANDRIGLVLFGSRAYLQAPITYDKKSVEEILLNMEAGMAGNTTAIGDAVGVALKYLKDVPNKDKKVIILLTDGANNDGYLTMPEAMNLAKQEGVKIYTIGVGSENEFRASFMGIRIGMPDEIDEAGLQKLAEETMGRYFRAKDTQQLQKVYAEIDKLEPNENEENFIQETTELFYFTLLAALVLGMIVVFYIRRRRG